MSSFASCTELPSGAAFSSTGAAQAMSSARPRRLPTTSVPGGPPLAIQDAASRPITSASNSASSISSRLQLGRRPVCASTQSRDSRSKPHRNIVDKMTSHSSGDKVTRHAVRPKSRGDDCAMGRSRPL